MLISLIIPVYNAENYLDKCLTSVINQTYKDIEVILINDGSTDDSPTICENFALLDNRIKLFHQPNGGVSKARNLGIEKSTGELITFVDSDDYLELDFITTLSKLFRSNIDFVLSSVNQIYEYKSAKLLFQFPNEETLDLKSFLQNYKIYQYFAGPWAKLYKAEIVKLNHIQFNLELAWGEDALFNVQYLKFCQNINITPYVGYNYRILNSGLSNNVLPFSYYIQFLRLIKQELISIEKNIGEFDKERNYDIIVGRILKSIYQEKDKIVRKKQLNKFYKEFKSEFCYYYKDNKGIGLVYLILLKFGSLTLYDKMNAKLRQ